MRKLLLVFIAIIFLLSSCSIAKFARYYAGAGSDSSSGRLYGLYYEKEDTAYIIGSLPDTWKRVEVRGGDLAFLNPQYNATITVNSTCDKNKTKYNLKALSSSLLIGIEDKRLIESREREVSSEISLQRIYEGNLSGVPIKISTVVVKRDECIYDMSYSSGRDNFGNLFGEFNEFVSRFKIAN